MIIRMRDWLAFCDATGDSVAARRSLSFFMDRDDVRGFIGHHR
jgi:hypothetical protein